MRIGNLGWATLGSVVLHVGVVGVFWPRTQPSLAKASSIFIQAQIVPAPLAEAPSTRTKSTAILQTQKVPASSRIKPAVSSPLTPANNTPAPQESESVDYLPIDAVDQPAVPVTDWIIDTDVLPQGYTLRLVLQLWISSDGNIDRWEIVGETANPVLTAKALAHLDNTVIQPALLHKIAVPSYRRLEVVVTRE